MMKTISLIHIFVPPQTQTHPLTQTLCCSTHSSQITTTITTRRAALSTAFSAVILSTSNYCWSKPSTPQFVELPDSGGVKALDIRIGDGDVPFNGDKVAIHYYGRLAAKQGWRFDSTYDHKDDTGEPIPFEFVLGSGKVISGIEAAVRSMKVGGVRRVVIPPSEGFQNPSQEPLPPNAINSATMGKFMVDPPETP